MLDIVWKEHPVIISLLSGLAGSLVGVVATAFLYWFDRYRTARRALVTYLELLFHDVYWNGDALNINRTWEISLRKIWRLQNTVADFAPPFRKRCVREAWETYKCEDKDTIEHLANDGMLVDNKRRPENKNEFKSRIRNFLLAMN